MITTNELIEWVKNNLRDTKEACNKVCVIDLESNLNTLIDRLETYEYLIFKTMGKGESENE